MTFKQTVLLAASLIPLNLLGSIAISFQAGYLQNELGSPLSDGSLIQILANKSGSTSFSSPTLSSFEGSPDIVIIDSFGLNSSTLGFGAGGFTYDKTFNLGDYGLDPGDALMLRWWSNLTVANTVPVAGATYGEFRTDSIVSVDGSTSGWFVPSDGADITLTFFTIGIGGSQPNSLGQASFTVVPEPSTYALGGLFALGTLVVVRRRKGK